MSITGQRRRTALYRAALAGDVPAEALTGPERRALLDELVRAGLSDVEIAVHTRWTVYTVLRMRKTQAETPNVNRNIMEMERGRRNG